jgi:hypothetical protein
MSRPSYLLTRASELENGGSTKDGKNVDEKEVEAATASFGDKPLIVLTRSVRRLFLRVLNLLRTKDVGNWIKPTGMAQSGHSAMWPLRRG